ncbi:vacuolar protein sorting-associated protein 37D-like protein [Lates japonicus]|uniref:Vacuolar protein sorting-associated protein 37D-like protein n=1 Tax=Lates japonicus TaxID=270547 RepID=A0AAD3MGN0_LATJO|nr:vacuolar protein sorting-associated protein 37D-like protein [Lates japonicus]
MHQVPNFDEAESTQSGGVTMSLSVQLFQFGVFRTRELRELLEDEEKINHIIRCSEKLLSYHPAATPHSCPLVTMEALLNVYRIYHFVSITMSPFIQECVDEAPNGGQYLYVSSH